MSKFFNEHLKLIFVTIFWGDSCVFFSKISAISESGKGCPATVETVVVPQIPFKQRRSIFDPMYRGVGTQRLTLYFVGVTECVYSPGRSTRLSLANHGYTEAVTKLSPYSFLFVISTGVSCGRCGYSVVSTESGADMKS